MTKQRSERVRGREAAPAGLASLVVAALAAALVLSACGSASPQSSASGPPQTSIPAPPPSSASALPGSASPPPSPDASDAAGIPPSSPSPRATSQPAFDRPTKKRPLRIYFGGDSLSGMPAVMLAQLTQKSGLARVKVDYVESSRLTFGEPVDWPARLRQQMSAGHWDIGIFMIGANDSGMPMLVGGTSVMYPKRSWLEEYERRARQIATIMLRAGVARVYWVGMPVMPDSSETAKMRGLNEVFEGVAAGSPFIEYVDSYQLLSTRDGDFKASVRSGDGVHYTDVGATIVAKAIWKAIKEGWGGE